MNSRRVTLRDLANHLGVSTATVSLALRDSPLVSSSTRQDVIQTAADLGYVYNRSAASLRTSRSNTIGVGFNDILNPYFTEMLAAIETATSDVNYTILLGTYFEDRVRQKRVIATLSEHQPDGLLVCPASGSDASDYAPAVDSRVPLVQVSREIAGSGFDFVGSDDVAGAKIALRYLHGLGHRRIALIGGKDSMSTGYNRRMAYREMMQEFGLPVEPELMIEGFGTREVGLKATLHLLDLPAPPTAVFCFNDNSAFGVLMGLAHRGLQAGRDLSVVGCDDVAEASQWAPALTTIQNHHDEIGQKAADLLLSRIAEPDTPAERVLVPPDLVVRGTANPPA